MEKKVVGKASTYKSLALRSASLDQRRWVSIAGSAWARYQKTLVLFLSKKKRVKRWQINKERADLECKNGQQSSSPAGRQPATEKDNREISNTQDAGKHSPPYHQCSPAGNAGRPVFNLFTRSVRTTMSTSVAGSSARSGALH